MCYANEQQRRGEWDRGVRISKRKSTGRRVDMKVQVNQIEYFIMEASRDSGGGSDKAKLSADVAKICQLSAEMACVVEKNTDSEFLYAKDTHIVACVVAGPRIRFYSLSHRGYACFFKELGTQKIPEDPRAVRQYLDLLVFLARIKIYLSRHRRSGHRAAPAIPPMTSGLIRCLP